MQTPFNAVGKIGMCAKCTSPWLRFKKGGILSHPNRPQNPYPPPLSHLNLKTTLLCQNSELPYKQRAPLQFKSNKDNNKKANGRSATYPLKP